MEEFTSDSDAKLVLGRRGKIKTGEYINGDWAPRIVTWDDGAEGTLTCSTQPVSNHKLSAWSQVTSAIVNAS